MASSSDAQLNQSFANHWARSFHGIFTLIVTGLRAKVCHPWEARPHALDAVLPRVPISEVKWPKMSEVEVLESLMSMLPDVTRLGTENVALKKENKDLRARIAELERSLAEAQADVLRKTSELKHANMRIRDLESSLKRKPAPPKPSEPRPLSESEELALSDELFEDTPPPERPPRPRVKRLSLLPQRSTIPDVIARISSTAPENMGALVNSLLCEQHPSVLAMKKFCTNLLNSAYVKLLTLKRGSPEVRNYLAFIAHFSERVSPKVFATFTSKIAPNTELASFVRACRDLCELDDV